MPVPKLRFKNDLSQDYPGWKVSKLGELFNVSAGGDIDKNNVRFIKTQDFCYPVYANALKNNGLYGYSNTYKIDGESFTITGRGDVGVAVSRHCNYTPIVRLLVCKPLHNENVDFFAECFNKTKIFIESTGVPQLTAPQVKNIKITYPSLSEQQKIADFLSTYDRQIDIQSQRVEAMKTRKKGLLQKIFSQKIRFKDEQGQDYPKWEGTEFGKVVSRKTSTEFSSNDLPGIEYEDIISGVGRLNKDVYTKQCDKKGIVFSKGDVLYGKLRPYLKNWLLPDFKGVAIGDFWVLTSKLLKAPFLYYFLQSSTFTKVANTSIGTKMPRADWKLVQGMTMEIPSFPEQEKIADFLIAVDTQIEVEEKRLETMKTIKKGLLQQMFI